MSATVDNPTTQNPRILVGTAMITAITTIGAAFLGIVPRLRGNDGRRIEQLNQQIEQLKQSSFANSKSDKALNISGTVYGPNSKPMTGRPDVYLVPLNNPKLIARTKANGEFQFNGVVDQQYWIIVRDPKLGKSGAGFMDKDLLEVPLDDVLVKFKVEKVEK